MPDDTTTILSLPLIMPSQAQKHVTHNEAIKVLDVLTQMTVLTRNLTVPPATPVLGEAHIVAPGATGVWAGKDGKIAVFYGIAWEFYTPLEGWQAYVTSEAAMVVYDGAAWVAASEGPAEFTELGVSTTADATNRLAVSSPAVLLTHAGAGHQVKINKAAATDTASLLFQTGFSGRAEMGTTGSDDFAIKVSADGSAFAEAVAFDRATGRTKVQNGLRLTPAAGDLAGPVDGEVWYDSTAAKFRARQNGASVDVIGAGSSGTFSDASFTLQDDGTPTKQAKFELSGLTAATTRTVTLPDASGTMVLTAAAQTLTNKTISLSANTVTGNLPATQVTMTGGGTAQDYAGFNNRPAFVSWASGKTPSVGAVIDAAGFSYRYSGSGTVISDLPGWVPLGYAYPDHWAQNTTPGTTDMAAAITSALGYSATVYLAGGIYAVGSTVAWDNATLIGNNDRGTARTKLQGIAASIPIGNAIVAPGRSSTIRAIQIGYDTLTGTETQDQRVGLDCRGLSQTLQRGSVIDEVVFDNVGTAISDYGDGEFSVTYGTLEIVQHSYRAVDIRGTNRTGSVWLNLYIKGGTTYTPEGGFCITGQGAGGMVGQLNIEHCAYTGFPIRLEGLQGLVINVLHLEGLDCSTAGFGYVGLDSCSITIHSLNVLNSRMSADDTAVVRLARAAYQSTAVVPLLANVSATSSLMIGKMHFKGLASPNNTLYPTYPVGRTGVRNCPGFNVFKRDTSYTDNNWLVEVQDFVWATFAAQAADRPFLEFPDVTYTGNIQVRRVGERGSNIVPYDNYVLNGAYDKWLTTTATVTSGATEVANKWVLRGTTGSATVDRIQDAFGAVGQYDARVTVGTAGTAQSWDQDIAFPVEWLGQPLRLSFDMKATAAGRVLEQITANLINTGGTPSTVTKQVISGTDTKLNATTAFKTYVLDFTAVDPVSVTTLGASAVMRLSFQFNDTTATRTPVVTFANVAVQRVAGVKFARAPYDRLALGAADVAGLGALATASTVSLTTQASGTLQAAQAPAHSGDVTSSAGSLALTIGAAAVTNAKLATMAATTLKGNNTGSAATPVDLTAAQVKTMLAIANTDVSGLGALATASTVNLTTQATGTLQAAQHPAHTGDVTNTAGALALTIGAGVVTNAKLATMAATTLKGNNTGATAAAADLTAAQVKTMLAIANTDVSGLGALATASTVNLTTQASGTLQAAQAPAHTGDVTSAAGALALTIGTGVVTNAKLATVATATLKGRSTAGTGAVEDLTGTQATALLDTFTSGAKGLVPASGGGTTTFLRADGSFATPTASASAGGSNTQVQYNTAGALAGAVDLVIENNQLRLPATTSFTAPASGGVRLIGRTDAGRTLPAAITQDGLVRDLQTSLMRSMPIIWKGQSATATLSAMGGSTPTAVGTATAASIATTNLYTMTPKLEYLVTVAATTAIAGFRSTVTAVSVGSTSAGLGGFHFIGRWGPATGVATTTSRAFFGLANITSAPTDVEPSTAVSAVFMGWDAADTNVQMMVNDATGTCTKSDLGAAFPVPTADRTTIYELSMYSPRGTTQSVDWLVTNLTTGATASGTFTTDLPTTATLLAPRGWLSVGGTSSVIGFGLASIYLDPLL